MEYTDKIGNASRFRKSLTLFNWQGGTIHQVNSEFSNVLEKLNSLPIRLKSVDIYKITDADFWLICDLYSRNKK